MSTEAVDPRIAKFIAIGLDPAIATQTVNNKKFAAILDQIITEAGVENGCERSVGLHLYALASKLPPDASPLTKTNRGDLYKAILEGRIRTPAQQAAAINYFKKKKTFDLDEFNTESGVGIVVTPEEVKATILKIFDENKEELIAQRYRLAGRLLGKANAELKWAEGAVIKSTFDATLLEVLGPKTEADLAPVAKSPATSPESKKAPAAGPAKPEGGASSSSSSSSSEGNGDMFALPDDFLKGRELEWAINTPEQLDEMKKATGGRVITRFPPEPNGYLHIGHAKAMMQNFGVAKRFNGECIMRFDDTNPEAEEKEYIDNILENLEFLGHKPARVTYSSDYFEELYQLAVKLIKKGKAYVCHQTADQIKKDREEAKKEGGRPRASPYRERSVDENLKLFNDMRKGKFEENECTLRMKGDLSHPNPNMWDTVFYRIRYSPHPHAGDKWCIYPTYDYTHCIIDSLEWISYSMCTLEFEVRRESYYWLLHELDLYKPKVWEYSRLNITHTVLSKRRLRALVMENHVNDWDDPRLATINGLRRRGFTAEIINRFIESIGVSRNEVNIPYDKLETVARDILLPKAPRAFVVVNPLKVTILNFDDKRVDSITCQTYPGPTNDETKGETYTIPLSKVVYIERDDFMEHPTSDFIRLAPGRVAHLKNAYNITVKNVIKDNNNNVTELQVEMDFANSVKPKAKLHWIAEPSLGKKPLEIELRLYNKLFKSEDPMSVEGDWRSDLNPDSLVVTRGYGDAHLLNAKVGVPYQFERVGFFVMDPDSKPEEGKLVFNRTCELRKTMK